jgi:hypothetical protein
MAGVDAEELTRGKGRKRLNAEGTEIGTQRSQRNRDFDRHVRGIVVGELC